MLRAVARDIREQLASTPADREANAEDLHNLRAVYLAKLAELREQRRARFAARDDF